MINCQLPSVVALRAIFFLKDGAPKAHPKLATDN
jgi:hypothetical protein